MGVQFELLKFFTYITVGLITVLFTYSQVIGFVYGGIFFNLGVSNFAKITDSSKGFIALASILFIVLISAAIIGMIGNMKQSYRLLGVYVTIVWTLFISFWIIFGICLNKKNNLDEEVIDLCNNHVASKFTNRIHNAYASNLATGFCSSQCPCASNKELFPSSEYASAIFKDTGASNIMDCPQSLYKDKEPSGSTIKFLSKLERKYECSGLCTREKWFYFSDVNKGPPLYSCQESIMNYMSEKFMKIYGIVLTCAIITFFAPVPAIALMYIKPRRVWFHFINLATTPVAIRSIICQRSFIKLMEIKLHILITHI